MGENVELGCRCGQIRGRAQEVSPQGVYRTVCYCDDCQAFLHFLERADLLNAHGGTDVVQVPPNMISFDRGLERIAAVRLSNKGLYRWYASCCKTPLGNTVDASVPFIGMPLEVFCGAADPRRIDALFGKPRSHVMGKFAIGSVSEAAPGLSFMAIAGALTKVLGWKLRGKTWPHPYFEKSTRQPKYPVLILQPAERDALREKCGPRPQ